MVLRPRRRPVVDLEGRNVGVPSSGVDGKFIDNPGGLIRRLAAETPGRLVPSQAECRFCDSTAGDCPERLEWEAPKRGQRKTCEAGSQHPEEN